MLGADTGKIRKNQNKLTKSFDSLNFLYIFAQEELNIGRYDLDYHSIFSWRGSWNTAGQSVFS